MGVSTFDNPVRVKSPNSHAITDEERGRGLAKAHHAPHRSHKKGLSGAEKIRRFLNCRQPGTMLRGKTRLQRCVENMVYLATSKKSPQAVAAFNALMNRAYGTPRPSDEMLDAVAKGGVQLVFISKPELDQSIPNANALPAPVPEFIDAEFEEEEDE